MNESHITTGIISFALTIYLSIYAFGLYENGLFWAEFVFFAIILVIIYLFLFYPIDFVFKNIEYIKNGDLKYGIRDYIVDEDIEHVTEYLDRTSPKCLYPLYYLYFIIFLSIVNVIIVLPIKGIVYLMRRK